MNNTTIQNDDPLLDTNQAAEFLTLQPQTLAAWRANGSQPELEFVRLGRHIRYSLSSLKKYLSSRTVGAAE